MQHHAIVAHCPTLPGGREMHGVQVGADRHVGLPPILAGIIGIKNVPALTHRDQALSRLGNVQQGAARGQGTGPGR
ncbi:hypothetical protein D3C87_2129560 [compost metagenome]